MKEFIKRTGVIISSGRGGAKLEEFITLSLFIELSNGIKIIRMNETKIGGDYEKEEKGERIFSRTGLSGNFSGRWGTYSPAGYYSYHKTCGGWESLFYVGEEIPSPIQKFPLYEREFPSFVLWDTISIVKKQAFEIYQFVPSIREFLLAIEKKEDRRRIIEFLPKEIWGECAFQSPIWVGENSCIFKKKKNSKFLELQFSYENIRLKYIERIPDGFRWKNRGIELIIYEDKRFKMEIFNQTVTGYWREEL